jgi:hypothetical protein
MVVLVENLLILITRSPHDLPLANQREQLAVSPTIHIHITAFSTRHNRKMAPSRRSAFPSSPAFKIIRVLDSPKSFIQK